MVAGSILRLKTASLQATVSLSEDDVDTNCNHTDSMLFEKSHFSGMYSSVRTSKNTGVMFLSEVALGKEHTITKDNSSLKKAPAGFDSVVARGSVEPGTINTPF